MPIIFGPVLSRRFGFSLGIDLSPEIKQCNYDCLYCELKASKTTLTILNPPKLATIIKEIEDALIRFKDIDVITLTANGEPTLYPYLRDLVHAINQIKKDKKLLILSNGSTIYNETISKALLDIDIVKLSLDSVNERTFRRIDRPNKEVKLASIIEGMKAFRREYRGELVLEILVVEKINDTQEEFMALNKVINEIKPDRVDISTIDRPSAYKVYPITYERLEILAKEIENIPTVIAKRVDCIKSLKTLNTKEILSLIEKRPQSEEDVRNLFSKESQALFSQLLREGKIALFSAANVKFYKIAQS